MALFEEGLPVSGCEHRAVEADGKPTRDGIYPLLAVPGEVDNDTNNDDSSNNNGQSEQTNQSKETDQTKAILDDAELRSYLSSSGQWACEDQERIDIEAEISAAMDVGEHPLTFADHIERSVDMTDSGIPVNYRLGVIVGALVGKEYEQPA